MYPPQSRNARVVPFTPPEWKKVQELYKSNDIECLKSSCEIFNLWKCRMGHATPVFINISELIHRAMLRDKSLSRDILDNSDIGLIFASAIIRFINYVYECRQSGIRGVSIASAVSKMQIPNWIVEIRHNAAHNNMPPVDYMRGVLTYCREWLWDRYWSRPFNEVIKETSKEIYEEEQAKKRNSVFDRIYDSLDKFTTWRKMNGNAPEIPATMRDRQPFKEIIECVTLYPEEFIQSFVEICISGKKFSKNSGESFQDTLFSKEKFTTIVSGEEQNFVAPLVRIMSDKNHLSTLLVELSRQIADYSLSPEVRSRLGVWACKILTAFLQGANIVSEQRWKVVLNHLVLAPQFYEKEVIEGVLARMKGKLRDLTWMRVTKLLEIRACREVEDIFDYSTFSVKTLNDLQNSIAIARDATSTKNPLNSEESWTLCTLDELGALGLTSKQTAESLSLELDLSKY